MPNKTLNPRVINTFLVSKSFFPSAAVFPLLPAALSCTLAPAGATCLWSADDHKLPFTPN